MIDKQLKELYNHYKTIMWPICTSVASVTILIFLIIPQLLSYLNVRGQISGLQTRADSLEAKAQDLQQMDEQKVTQDFQSAFTVLPVDPEIPSALVALQALAAQSGLKVGNTTYASGQRTPGKNSFTLNLTVTGSITGMRSFLMSLQSAIRIFQVDAISARFTKNNTLEAEITIAVYYDPSTNVKWSVEEEVPKFSSKEEELLTLLNQQVDNANQKIKAQEASYSAVPMGKLNLFD